MILHNLESKYPNEYNNSFIKQGKRQNKMGQNKISLIFPNNPLFLRVFSLIIFVTSFSLLIVGFSPNLEKMFFFSLIFAYFFLIFSGVLFWLILFCPILEKKFYSNYQKIFYVLLLMKKIQFKIIIYHYK